MVPTASGAFWPELLLAGYVTGTNVQLRARDVITTVAQKSTHFPETPTLSRANPVNSTTPTGPTPTMAPCAK